MSTNEIKMAIQYEEPDNEWKTTGQKDKDEIERSAEMQSCWDVVANGMSEVRH